MEDFVTYEVAKKLKGAGFKFNKDYRLDRFFMANEINTPTISQAMKWLRKEKKIAINIEYIPRVWQYKLIDMSFDDRFEPFGKTFYNSYESAALAGIEYVLDNLI